MIKNNASDNKKGKEKSPKSVMHNTVAQHSLTDVRPHFPNSDQAHLPSNSPQLLSMMFYGLEYTFGQFRSPVLALLPPSFFCVLPHWQSMRQEKKKNFLDSG